MMTLMGYAGPLMQIGVMTPQNIYEVAKKVLDLWGIKDVARFVKDPREAELLRQAMGGLERLGQLAASGQLPPVRNIAELLQHIYMILGQVASMNVDGGAQPRSNSEGAMEDDGRGTVTGFISEGAGGTQAPAGDAAQAVPAAGAGGLSGA
ncbi:MAG: hypothetical protein LUC51_09760 [Cloacibacillus porcorum]|nr:hypothetical protein [Cloacibacillus porcorum]